MTDWLRRWRRQWELQTMVLPGVIFIIIFNFIPIYGLLIAFKSYTVVDTFDSAPWVGIENFRIIASDPFFWGAVGNTLAISMLGLTIGFMVPLLLAIMMFELRESVFRRAVQTVSYMPHFLSWVVLGGMVVSWLSTRGLLNTILGGFGINTGNPAWLLDQRHYWFIAVLSDIWKEAGWGTILYFATLTTINPAFYEAAKIDGASRWQQIWHITIPMLSPIISLNLILTISGLFNSNFDQAMVLMNSQNRPRAEVISTYVYQMGIAQGDFSYATAVGLGISVISAMLLIASNQMTRRLNDNSSVL
jgi:putative aldouronate transport system permease protein